MDLTKIFPLFDSGMGITVLALYAIVVLGLTYAFSRGYNQNKESYLVAKREVGGWAGAASIGAAWVWAPAMYVSAQQAYQNGITGLFWFTIGNFLTLILFSFFAKKVRERKPDGFTISGYIKEKFSPRVQNIFLIELFVLAVCSFATNVLAGSKSVEILTGLPTLWISIALAGLALAYSIPNGLKASVVTEIFKIVMLWTGLFILVPWAISAGGGWDTVVAGLGGITGNGMNPFVGDFALGVFLGFGASTALGHFGAPWGDNSFWTRAFAVKAEKVQFAFIGGALLFVVIPLLAGMLGFLAAGLGYEIPKELVGYTNIVTLGSLLPNWSLLLFLFIAFAGLVGVLDSQLSSAANLVGNDLYDKYAKNLGISPIVWSRAGMVALAVAGLILANWPGMTIQTIFVFFGVMRATVWIPTMLSIWKPSLITEKGMFWGILIAYLVGMPIFLYGQFGGGNNFTFTGTLIGIFGSGVLATFISSVDKQKTIAA